LKSSVLYTVLNIFVLIKLNKNNSLYINLNFFPFNTFCCSDGSYRRDSPPLSPQQSVVALQPNSNPPLTHILTTTAVAPQPPQAAKVAIPKIRRPTVAANTTSAAAAAGPIVLTLGSDGLYYPAPASLLIKAESTAALATATSAALGAATSLPTAITSGTTTPAAAETFRTYCSPLVAGMPTVPIARDAEDVSPHTF
jgi:hypothetical protein